jgi:hypothetical protein
MIGPLNVFQQILLFIKPKKWGISGYFCQPNNVEFQEICEEISIFILFFTLSFSPKTRGSSGLFVPLVIFNTGRNQFLPIGLDSRDSKHNFE